MSGKTCIVGMLALGEPHPGSGTCTRIPPPPSGDGLNKPASSLTREERDAEGLRLGKDWIDKAVEALRARRRVLATPVSPDAKGGGLFPMIDLKFGDEHRGEFRVRMVDYSGELVGMVARHDAPASAAALKAILAECDGLLILAEAPTASDRLASAAPERLPDLRAAFAGLAESGERWCRTPVAVLVSKWDRVGPIAFDDPAAEIPKLEAFLTSHLPHNELVKEIRNTMAGQTDAAVELDGCAGLRWANTAVFACSAFGQAQIDSDAAGKSGERRGDDGRPFGLIEPFVWLADRRDELDVDAVRSRFDGTLRSPRALWFRHWRDLRTEALRVLARLPGKSLGAANVRQIARHAACWGAGTALALGFIVFLIGTSSWGGWLRGDFRLMQAGIERPDADMPTLDGLRGRLEALRGAREKLPFAPNSDELAQAIHALDDRIDGILWAPVEKAASLPEKAQQASQYLGKLPNGVHAREATAFVSENVATNQRQQNVEFLVRMNDAARQAQDEPTLNRLLAEFVKLPVPELADKEQWAKFHQLRRDCETRLAGLLAQRSWDEYIKQFRNALVAERWTEAVELLVERRPRSDEWKALAGRFPAEVTDAASGAAKSSTAKAASYEDSVNRFKRADDALKRMESSLRADEPKLADQALAGQQTIRRMRADLDVNRDRELYSSLINPKAPATLADCEKYLDKAPLKSMGDEVRKYKKWLKEMEEPLTLTLSVSVLWDAEWSNDDENELEVFLDDVGKLKTTTHFPTTPGKDSGKLGTITIPAKRRETAVKIRGKIIEYDTFSSNDDAGQGHATLKLNELIERQAEGARVPLSTPDGKTNQLVLRVVSGLPVKPGMPTWTSKSSP